MRKLIVLLCCVLFFCLLQNARAVSSGPPPTVGYMKIFRAINDAKGKIVLVNFFATWCGPCLAEIPGLIALRKQYPEKDIVMMGISMDTDYGKLRTYLHDVPVNYTVYQANAQVGQIFQVAALPKMLVYDQKGALALNHDGFLPPEKLKKILDGLLQKRQTETAGEQARDVQPEPDSTKSKE